MPSALKPRFAARDRQVEVDRRLAGVRDSEVDVEAPSASPAAVEMHRAPAERQRGARITRRKLEKLAIGGRLDVARRGGLTRAVDREADVVAIAAWCRDVEVGIAGHGPVPLRPWSYR